MFKALQGLLFFGAALGFGIWQLVAVHREIREEFRSHDPDENCAS